MAITMLVANKVVWLTATEGASTYYLKVRSQRRLGIPPERVISKEAIRADDIITHPDDKEVIQRVVDRMVAAIKEAVDNDGAEAAVTGPTDLLRHGISARVKARLIEDGYGDIPVIDSGTVVIKLAKIMAEMGLVQSKRAFPRPKGKQYFIKGRWVDDPLA